jgi:hypothetical protein
MNPSARSDFMGKVQIVTLQVPFICRQPSSHKCFVRISGEITVDNVAHRGLHKRFVIETTKQQRYSFHFQLRVSTAHCPYTNIATLLLINPT